MSYLVYVFDKRRGFASFEKYTFSRAYEVLAGSFEQWYLLSGYSGALVY